MAFYIKSNVGYLIATNRKRIADYTPAMLVVEKLNMQEIKKQAIKNTSYTAYKLNSMRPVYPYSHQFNAPPIAPYFANMQSTEMSQSWKVSTQPTPTGITSSIWNTQPYSKYFDGKPTEKMVPRDILGYILTKTRRIRLERLHKKHVDVLSRSIAEALDDF